MLTTTIDRAHYRSVMGHLPTGVVAVSAIVPGTATPCGLVVGTFQSLSLEPALVSFSVADTSTSWPKLRSARRLCASVLAAGQESVCRALSSKHPDKFAFLDWSLSPAGSACITGAHAWIDCEVTHELYARRPFHRHRPGHPHAGRGGRAAGVSQRAPGELPRAGGGVTTPHHRLTPCICTAPFEQESHVHDRNPTDGRHHRPRPRPGP